MAQWDNRKLVSHMYRFDFRQFLFIKNLINDKSKYEKKNVTICIVIIYNMYNSMPS